MDPASGPEPVITSRNLRKMYGPHLALDDINLEISPGAIGILGPNGAGTVSYTHLTLPTKA